MARVRAAVERGDKRTAGIYIKLAARAYPEAFSDLPSGSKREEDQESPGQPAARKTTKKPAPDSGNPTVEEKEDRLVIPPQTTPPTEKPEDPVSLPFEYTLTDTTGRQIKATILSVSKSSLKFRRAVDAKEFEIPFSLLCPDDREFFDRISRQ